MHPHTIHMLWFELNLSTYHLLYMFTSTFTTYHHIHCVCVRQMSSTLPLLSPRSVVSEPPRPGCIPPALRETGQHFLFEIMRPQFGMQRAKHAIPRVTRGNV